MTGEVPQDQQQIDRGHENLIHDLKSLLDMAERFEFHDFKNERFATPKVALRSFLLEFAKKVESGEYDN